MTKRLEVGDVSYQFQIWDTAGQEKYRSLAPMYYRGASAAIIVYDITREATYRTVKDWVRELKRNCTADMVIAIAGNKSDLNDLREVRARDAEEYAQSIGALFIETSALSAVNVPHLFTAIAEGLPPEDPVSFRPGSTVQLRRQDESSQPKSSCCGSKKSR